MRFAGRKSARMWGHLTGRGGSTGSTVPRARPVIVVAHSRVGGSGETRTIIALRGGEKARACRERVEERAAQEQRGLVGYSLGIRYVHLHVAVGSARVERDIREKRAETSDKGLLLSAGSTEKTGVEKGEEYM